MMRRAMLLASSPTLTSAGVVNGIIQDDWDAINQIAKAGRAQEFYSIGDTKVIKINGYDVPMYLVGFDHDDVSDGMGKANTTWFGTPSIEWNTAVAHGPAIDSRKLFDIDWSSSEQSSAISYAEGLYQKFPKAVQEGLVEVSKTYQEWNGSALIKKIRYHKVWIPSAIEFGVSVTDRTQEGKVYSGISKFTSKLSNLGKVTMFSTRTLGTTQSTANHSKYIYAYNPVSGNCRELAHEAFNSIVFGFCL